MKKIYLSICLSIVMTFAFGQWAWDSEVNIGKDLNSVYVTEPGQAWIVGGYAYGEVTSQTILRYSNGVYANNYSNSNKTLSSCNFYNNAFGYAVGGFLDGNANPTNVVLKYNGIDWIEQTVPTSKVLKKVCIVDENHIWASGGNYSFNYPNHFSTILFNNGTFWDEELNVSGLEINDMFMLDNNTGWVGGFSFDQGVEYSEIYYYNGSSWEQQFHEIGGRFGNLFFTDLNSGWATIDGVIFRFDGVNWIAESCPVGNINALYLFDFTSGYAVNDSVILKYNGTEWNIDYMNPEIHLKSIHFFDPDYGLAVGSGTILEWDGVSWNEIVTPHSGPSYIAASFSDAINGYAITNDKIYKHSNTGWQLENGIYEYLNSISSVDQINTWVCGSNGKIFKNSSSGWIQQATGVDIPIYGIHFINATHGWAVGGCWNQPGYESKLLSSNGIGWTNINAPVNTNYYSCYFIDENNGWAVGQNGTILKYSNGVWSQQNSPVNKDLFSVNFTSITNGWAVGEEGTIINYDGNNWYVVNSPINKDLKSICFVNNLKGWAVGNDGVIISIDGNNLSLYNSPTSNNLTSVCFSDENNGWICGKNGTILHTINGGSQFVENNKIAENNFNVWPNPTTNELNISCFSNVFEKVSIILFNVSGEQIMKNEFQNQKQIEINISSLQKGIYMIQIQTEFQIEVKKLIIQ